MVEGCYADLLELASAQASEMVFLDLPVTACISNARSRPWEPHKYDSKEAQDANLGMLLDWIGEYYRRDDVCSREAHRALFDSFKGSKQRHERNPVYDSDA